MGKRIIKNKPGLGQIPTVVRGKTKTFIRQQQKRLFDKNGKEKNKFEVIKNKKDIARTIIDVDRKEKTENYKTSIKDLPQEQQAFIGSLNKDELIKKINERLKDEEVKKLFNWKGYEDDNSIKILGYSAITGGLYELYSKYPELIELRGLIVKTDQNRNIVDIVARPYPKFFNHGETEALKFDNLPQDKADKIVISEKYDGSLIIGQRNPQGNPDISTKGSFTSSQRNKAKEQMEKTEEGKRIQELIRDLDELGYTPLFEYVDKDMRLTVKYDESFMVLTGVRNKATGEFLSHEAITKLGDIYGVKVAKQYEFKNKEDLLNFINGKDNFEGVVVRFDFKDGSLIVKVKSDWYFKHFKILNTLGGALGEKKQTPLYAMDAIIAGEMDDIITKLPDDIRSKVEKIKELMISQLKRLHSSYYNNKLPPAVKQKIDKILYENGVKDMENLTFDDFIKFIYPHYRKELSRKIKKALN